VFRTSRLFVLVATIAFLLIGGARLFAAGEDPLIHGLPWTRLYPFEEIGNAPRRVRLSFDPYGRLAVVYDQVYAVLNDSTWLDLVQASPMAGKSITAAMLGRDGQTYFCGRGVWGILRLTPEGQLDLRVLPAEKAPEWARAAAYSRIVLTPGGVGFQADQGLVLWDFKTASARYIAIPALCQVFTVGERLFASCFGDRLFEIDLAKTTLVPVQLPLFSGKTFDRATGLDAGATLLSSIEGTLYSFNGDSARLWAPQEAHHLVGKVTALETLRDHAVAIAIEGKGVFVVAPEGEVVASLPTAEFQRVNSLASNEAGVLWATTEDGVMKILYRAPMTAFGQRLGLPASWPTVARRNQQVFVATGSRLYRSEPGLVGAYTRFEPWKGAPQIGAWTVASNGENILVGNATGVFSISDDEVAEKVISIAGVKQLVFTSKERCFVMGEKETALLHFANGRWQEESPRVASLGSASMAHASPRAVWLEFGGNRIARIGFEHGRLVTREFRDLPWGDTGWISVGIVGDIVVLTSSGDEHIYFDDAKETWTQDDQLDRLLKRSPYWITRVFRDSDGVLWGTHHKGVVRFVPAGNDYTVDATSLDLAHEQFPMIQMMDGNDVWISSGGSLYHLSHRVDLPDVASAKPPVLVSMLDGKKGLDLAKTFGADAMPLRLPNDHNSLAFLFFSGSYQGMRSARLLYRINASAEWKPFDSGSLLRLDELRDGHHVLEVRQSDFAGHPSETITLPFEILPPWHRTWQAYPCYAAAALLAGLAAVKLSRRQMRRRNQELERLIGERTKELEAAMIKLNEETRNAAVFAERNRLAGEIQSAAGIERRDVSTGSHVENVGDAEGNSHPPRHRTGDGFFHPP